jgi:hypothetical protein
LGAFCRKQHFIKTLFTFPSDFIVFCETVRWLALENIDLNGRRGLNLTSNLNELESFVDADAAAEFLSLTRRRVLDLARSGALPAHPIGEGARRVWRFRLSELSTAVASRQNSVFTSE